jgi:hypothetical protein
MIRRETAWVVQAEAAAHGEEALAGDAEGVVPGDSSQEAAVAAHCLADSCVSGEPMVVHMRRREVYQGGHHQGQLTLG